MLTFSKQEFMSRLHNATEELLGLVLSTEDKDEATRLFDKRSAVEECLAWWFSMTIDLDEDESYLRLSDFREVINYTISTGSYPETRSEGYKLVLSYIDEY